MCRAVARKKVQASLVLLSLQLCIAVAPPDTRGHDDDRKLWSGVASSSDGANIAAVIGGFRGAGGHIYVSRDAGKSWSPVYMVRSWRAIASSGDGSMLVAVEDSSQEREGGFIHTSADGGSSWTIREGAGCRHWLSVASSSDGQHLAAVVGGYTGNGLSRHPSPPRFLSLCFSSSLPCMAAMNWKDGPFTHGVSSCG